MPLPQPSIPLATYPLGDTLTWYCMPLPHPSLLQFHFKDLLTDYEVALLGDGVLFPVSVLTPRLSEVKTHDHFVP